MPFVIHKKKISKDIRVVSRNLMHRNTELNLTADDKVCSRCQKLLTEEPFPKQECQQISSCTTSIDSSEDELRKNVLESEFQISKINTSLVTVLDNTPIKKKLSKNPNYAKKKFKKVKLTMKKMFEVASMESLSFSGFSETQMEIVKQLKKKNSMK